MSSSLRDSNHLAIPSSILLIIVVLLCGCSFPTSVTPPPEATEPASPNTPTDSDAVPPNTPPSSAPTLSQPPDQAQTEIDRANQTAIGGVPHQNWAQVFTVSQSGYISYLALPLQCQSITMLSVRIEAASGGVPGGQLLAEQVIPGTALTTFVEGIDVSYSMIAFSNPPSVSAGELYAFVLEVEGGDCNLYWGPPGDTYSGGSAFFELEGNPPGWREVANPVRDLAFKVFISDSIPVD